MSKYLEAIMSQDTKYKTLLPLLIAFGTGVPIQKVIFSS